MLHPLYCRAAHQLWGESIYEYLCVDTSQEMGEMARLLRLGTEVGMVEEEVVREEMGQNGMVKEEMGQNRMVRKEMGW